MSRISLCLLAVAAFLAMAAPATASAATGDPSANRSLSRTTRYDCSADPAGSACIASALADINAAHAAEGVPAMVLPPNFASMSVPVQLLNLANLERVDRGLTPILGLSAALDADAQAAAAQDADPMPTHFYGNTATSNWAGGDESALEADFEWMYDDGAGSGNLDCTSSNTSGCWGHRHDILWHFSAPIAMGAGYGTGAYGPSMTELFVGGDTRTGPGQADAPVVRPSQTAAASSGAPRPPRARVAALATGRASVNLTLACAGAPGSVCKVNVALGRADVSATISAGHRRVLHVALGAAARRLLVTRHVLHVRVVVKQRARTLLTRVVALAA